MVWNVPWSLWFLKKYFSMNLGFNNNYFNDRKQGAIFKPLSDINTRKLLITYYVSHKEQLEYEIPCN